ncbi:MAG: segregation/condensation protein A [Polyangiaceae bacterium]|nr:segregation/condensation protein A [Polyangiaceae bacterium]MCW5790769.1 segregation/condensation protein A [Polyangiaceae bacterium]
MSGGPGEPTPSAPPEEEPDATSGDAASTHGADAMSGDEGAEATEPTGQDAAPSGELGESADDRPAVADGAVSPPVDTLPTADGAAAERAPDQPTASKPSDALAAPDAEGRPDHAVYRVTLEGFEGPLDLLLHLVQQHELDILDIPIAFIAKKYTEYLRLMTELEIDVAAEYLVMAATLTYIKSRMLLPPDPSQADEDAEEGEEEDPRAELIRRLLEYQKYKAAAEELGGRDLLGRDIFPRGIDAPTVEGPAPLAPIGVFKLLGAFQAVLDRAKKTLDHTIDYEQFSITEKIGQLSELLSERPHVRFEELFEEDQSRGEIVVTFLALLEMTRLRLIRIEQAGPFETIHISLAVLPGAEGAEALEALDSDGDDSEPAALGDPDELASGEALTALDGADAEALDRRLDEFDSGAEARDDSLGESPRGAGAGDGADESALDEGAPEDALEAPGDAEPASDEPSSDEPLSDESPSEDLFDRGADLPPRGATLELFDSEPDDEASGVEAPAEGAGGASSHQDSLSFEDFEALLSRSDEDFEDAFGAELRASAAHATSSDEPAEQPGAEVPAPRDDEDAGEREAYEDAHEATEPVEDAEPLGAGLAEPLTAENSEPDDEVPEAAPRGDERE